MKTSIPAGLAWRALTRAAGLVSFGGRYHDELGLADRMLVPARAPDAKRLIARWEIARRAAPDQPVSHYGLSSALRRAGRHQHAGEVIERALARFPDDLGTIVEAARVAARCGDEARAHDLWARAARRPLPRPLWLAGAAHSALALGRYDESERLLVTARRSHPRHRGLQAVEAMLASAREDWPQAIALWSAFYRRYPNYPGAWDFLGRAIHSGKMSEMEDGKGASSTTQSGPAESGRATRVTKAAKRAEVGLVVDEAVRDLLLGFESLGENCELGLVQRRYGAEPLGLFRWNIVWTEDLIEALRHRLEGIGEPEHTELVVLSNREFFLQDSRWYLGRHTFKFEGQTTHDELYAKMCERTRRLRGDLLDCLSTGQRILVYCSKGLTTDELEALQAALAALGPNRLLVVQPAEPAAAVPFRGRPGELVQAGPRCWVGFLAHRGIGSDGTWTIAFEDWIAICRKVAAAAV